MLKRKKPRLAKTRRLINIASERRRVKRNISKRKLHRRRDSYHFFFTVVDSVSEPSS